MKSAVAIRFVHFEDLGTFEELLQSDGFTVRYVEAAQSSFELRDAAAADLLISLGGPIGAYEDNIYPCLKPILASLERRIGLDLPTLGICLGAQLIARAAGARVYPGSGKEIGWVPLRISKAGQLSPLRHLASTPVLHWHGDTFDLPRGATLLASTDRYANQAFALGRNVLALQFHPEASAERLEHWYIGHACEIAAAPAVEVPQLRTDANRFAAALKADAGKLMQEWLKQVSAPGKAHDNPAAAAAR